MPPARSCASRRRSTHTLCGPDRSDPTSARAPLNAASPPRPPACFAPGCRPPLCERAGAPDCVTRPFDGERGGWCVLSDVHPPSRGSHGRISTSCR
eukprot:6624698-Prymnesium_polylepis.1